MIAEAVRRSPLAPHAARFSALNAKTSGALAIREIPFVTQADLRADAGDQRVLAALREVLGIELPTIPNTVSSGASGRALWLGPDEWLVVAPQIVSTDLERTIQSGLSGASGSVVDVSASRTVLQVGGSAARDLLSHGIAIDLDARVFTRGRCAQTLLARVPIIIERVGSDFQLYVRASFASYVGDWLLDAASAGASLTSGR